MNKKMPILVVDDFATMRRIVKNCLEQLGFDNIHEAPDGQVAWDKIQKEDFDFIVSDWNMPNKLGIDLLRDVRSSENYSTIPFLIVTAAAQRENILEATKAGVSSHITRPFTADLLSDKIEEIFRDKV